MGLPCPEWLVGDALLNPEAEHIRRALWESLIGVEFFAALGILMAGTILFMAGLSRFAAVPILVGILVVTFGTTLPEIVLVAFSSQNGLSRSADFFEQVASFKANSLAYGIIIGSTAINLFFVMPIARFTRSRFVVNSKVVYRDVFFLIAVVVALMLVTYFFNHITFGGSYASVMPSAVGWGLIGAAFAYVIILTATERTSSAGVTETVPSSSGTGPNMLLISSGILLIGIVSFYLVEEVTFPAIDGMCSPLLSNRSIAAPEIFALGFFIGFIVALPEFVHSVFFGRDQNAGTGLTTGNILTSCILNLTVVAGLGIIIAELLSGLDSAGEKVAVRVNFDFIFPHLFFIFVGGVLLWIFFITREGDKSDTKGDDGTFAVYEAGILMAVFVVYICYLLGAEWAVGALDLITDGAKGLFNMIRSVAGLSG